MPRKSSIHFKPVSNVRFSISHSERTDLSEPAYLLPKEYQLGNVIVPGSLSENELAARFIQQKEGMSRQAKTAGSSPFWEGVVVLPNTNSQEQSANLQAWKVAYEQATGHKVLHMSVHLDEGYMDTDGKPQYNPHAHVIVSRMDLKNRVIHLGRKQLAQVQDLTAEQLKMERGSTLDERDGHRGRKHIPHKEFKQLANEKRLELDYEKHLGALRDRLIDSQNASVRTDRQKLAKAQLEASKVQQLQADLAASIHQIAQIKEQYRLDREALKASGEAKQADYQALKKAYEELLAIHNKPKKEKKNDTRQHPKFAKDPTGILDMQDVFGCNNVHDLRHFEDVLQQDASGELRPLQTDPNHPDLQQLDPPGAQVNLLQEALAKLAIAQEQADKVPKLEAVISQQTQAIGNLLINEDRIHKISISQAQELAQLKAEYAAERAVLKASGQAKQADYQVLKKAYDAALAELKATKEKVREMEKSTAEKLQEIADLGKAVTSANEAWTEKDYALTDALNKASIATVEVRQLREKLAASADELADVKAKFADMAKEYQKYKAQGKDPALFVPGTPAAPPSEAQHHSRMAGDLRSKATKIREQVANGEKSDILLVTAVGHELAASKITRIAQEAVKTQTHTIPLPTSEKSLQERLKASYRAFVDWIKGNNGQQAEIDTERSDHYGPVVQVDDLHAVQKTDRTTYAIHKLQHLDKVPALNDSKTEITYRGGKGSVKGQGLGKGGRAD